MGYRVGVLKPIETGVVATPHDGTELSALARQFNSALESFSVDQIVPIQFELPAAPYVANHGETIDLAPVDRALEQLEKCCDIVLIEGAGGLLVPIDRSTMIIDLVKRYHAKTLLVTHGNLGCINDTLLNMRLLDEQEIAYTWAVNIRHDDTTFKTVSEPYFLDRFGSYHELTGDIEKVAQTLLNL